MSLSKPKSWLTMEFPERLTALRKGKSLTQKALAERVGVHITQIQRYENGAIQPTLDVLKRLAIALSVSADLLVFDKEERGPDDQLRLEFEAISEFDPDEKLVVRKVLQGLIIQHQNKRWSTAS
ncbi:hypothetical protein MCAMS1_01057 [biofilm metagenome]